MSILLTACGDEIPDEHEEFIEENGWNIQSQDAKDTLVVDDIEPMNAMNMRKAGFDISLYEGKEITVTHYDLKEKFNGEHDLQAAIYELNGEIIGGVGVVEGATPGIVSLDQEKEQ
ncbi:DUF4830 domain-containing protein [Bacillus sp. Marseille-Q1617]|uniref:DUF4830 domain-containing protein n=1 Tax=Bacillus sp. Marseille-Q1617 TaxID=2736887 RepID=UPI001589CCC0|nr:DUF4830 domain-containing protein [Bacillus sp. Marseille-Q1617]